MPDVTPGHHLVEHPSKSIPNPAQNSRHGLPDGDRPQSQHLPNHPADSRADECQQLQVRRLLAESDNVDR